MQSLNHGMAAACPAYLQTAYPWPGPAYIQTPAAAAAAKKQRDVSGVNHTHEKTAEALQKQSMTNTPAC